MRRALFDRELKRRLGARTLVGVDEAGRGPLAGPVVAAAVLLPESPPKELRAVRDSKRLSPSRRERLFLEVRRSALAVGVGWAVPVEIDRWNILQASFAAMRRALDRLKSPPGFLVAVDGPWAIPGLDALQEPVVGGDDRSLSIACASIVAKVLRDRWMRVLERRHPGYGFARHKGYGTREHYGALARLGPCAAHRRSFRLAGARP